ncbi:MAG: glucan-binding protein, partial [Clostridium sp.]
MRKQTKLVAVLSAAALLAIGASMTSFAAGWQKSDDGTWQYYDKDDEMVTGEWKKDGAKWFYLDD